MTRNITTEKEDLNPLDTEVLALDKYDFLDFGCSNGGSINFSLNKLGGKKGAGLDIDKNKVKKTIELGYDALVADVSKLEVTKESRVSFVTMFHFLEHLPSLPDANKCIHSALKVAEDYVLIKQPFFDTNGYLMSKGLKMFYSDWTGHQNLMTSFDFFLCLRPLLETSVENFYIFGKGLITDSMDDEIISLESPINVTKIRTKNWKAGSDIEFELPVYNEIIVVIILKNAKPSCMQTVIDAVKPTKLLYTSEGSPRKMQNDLRLKKQS